MVTLKELSKFKGQVETAEPVDVKTISHSLHRFNLCKKLQEESHCLKETMTCLHSAIGPTGNIANMWDNVLLSNENKIELFDLHGEIFPMKTLTAPHLCHCKT